MTKITMQSVVSNAISQGITSEEVSNATHIEQIELKRKKNWKEKLELTNTYTRAYTEVLEILSHFSREEYDKIPNEKIEFFNKLKTIFNK